MQLWWVNPDHSEASLSIKLNVRTGNPARGARARKRYEAEWVLIALLEPHGATKAVGRERNARRHGFCYSDVTLTSKERE